jgi:exonuclease SbcC
VASLQTQQKQVLDIARALEMIGTNPAEASLSEGVAALSGLTGRIAAKQADRDRLLGIKRRLESASLSEIRLQELLAALNISIPFPSAAFNDSVKHIKAEQNSILSSLAPRLASLEAKAREAARERATLTEQLGLGDDTAAAESKLRERRQALHSGSVLLDEVAHVIEVDNDEPIERLLVRTRSARNAANNFAASLPRVAFQSRLQELQGEIDRNNRDLAQAREQHVRAETACSVLNEILTVNSREKYLQRFFEIHKKAIVRIFRRIHVPHEFVEIDFHETGPMEIALITERDRQQRRLSEVSTGQRAALAVSIFLALNSLLKNGPPIILLDDPVAHVDDLNTLSFLDYITYIGVKNNRQKILTKAKDKL